MAVTQLRSPGAVRALAPAAAPLDAGGAYWFLVQLAAGATAWAAIVFGIACIV